MTLLNKNRHKAAHASNGLRVYTLATLPAVGGPGSLIYVSDANGVGSPLGSPPVYLGAVAYSDGTVWRDVATNAVVS